MNESQPLTYKSLKHCYDEDSLIVMFKAYIEYCDKRGLIPDYVEAEFYGYLETRRPFYSGFVQNLEYHYFSLIQPD